MRCNLAHLCELCLNAFADVEIWFRKMNKQTGSTDINEKLKTAGGYNCEKEKSLLLLWQRGINFILDFLREIKMKQFLSCIKSK